MTSPYHMEIKANQREIKHAEQINGLVSIYELWGRTQTQIF